MDNILTWITSGTSSRLLVRCLDMLEQMQGSEIMDEPADVETE